MSEATVQLAADLIAIPSPSGGERAVAERCAAELDRHGFAVSVDAWGNVLGEAGSGAPRLLFDGHLDTVAANPGWTRDPLEPAVSDGRLYGLGATDMKGPVAALILGVADAVAAGEVRGTVGVSLSTLEEVAEGAALAPVVDAFEPDRVIIAEPSGLKLAVAQRGRAEIVVEIEGRAAHAAYPDEGRNAIDAASRFLSALEHRRETVDDELGRTILVATEISSEPLPGISVVPSRARLRLDRRTLPGEDERSVLAELQPALAAAQANGCRATARVSDGELRTYTDRVVDAHRFLPAWRVGPSDFVTAAATALDRVLPGVPRSHYAFCTNGSLTAGRRGIPTLGFGPGDPAHAHQADESIDVAALAGGRRGYRALAALHPSP